MQTLLNPGIPTFQELTMPATLPLATLHGAVLDFIRDREDVVLFGAYAVNAYVPEPRMTQDIDLLSTRMEAVATDLRDHLAARFRIALRLRVGHLVFHHLRRLARVLGVDNDLHIRQIWQCVYRGAQNGKNPGHHDEKRGQQHQKAVAT